MALKLEGTVISCDSVTKIGRIRCEEVSEVFYFKPENLSPMYQRVAPMHGDRVSFEMIKTSGCRGRSNVFFFVGLINLIARASPIETANAT